MDVGALCLVALFKAEIFLITDCELKNPAVLLIKSSLFSQVRLAKRRVYT